MNNSQEVEDIRAEMAQIRCDLNEDVEDLVEHAREMADWRYYVRSYPLASAAAAAALGYLVVPKKPQIISPNPKTLAQLARKNQLVVVDRPKAEKRRTLSGSLFNLVASLAMRGLMAYVGQQAGKVMGQQAAQETEQASRPVPPSGMPR